MKALKVNRAMIGIENNKPDAIEHLRNLCEGSKRITVHPLKVKYPQGGEKQLIKALINREVPYGGLPIDVGVMVQNVQLHLQYMKLFRKTNHSLKGLLQLQVSHLHP